MRSISTALVLLGMLSPVMAAELSKADREKIGAAYEASFNKKDAAGIAALFTKDGIHVNQSGIRKPAEFYGEVFKSGFDKLDAKVEQVYPLTADTAIASGTFVITGKSDKGEALKASGRWSDTLINEGGAWKIKMLTAFPDPEKK
jgi:ketosteroid isomerase-like protein